MGEVCGPIEGVNTPPQAVLLTGSNKAGRVLLVTALSNLGSMLGAWVAAGAYAGWITL